MVGYEPRIQYYANYETTTAPLPHYPNKNVLSFCSFSKCADTELLLERKVLRETS